MGDRLDHLRILIVSSDGHGEAAARILAERGAAVATATSADAGLAMVRAERFDVLLSEAAASNADGSTFIDALRNLPPEVGGRIPAIALHHPATLRIPSAHRFHDVVAVPVDPERLMRSVCSVAPAADAALKTLSSPDADVVRQPGPLRVLVVDDTKVVADVLGQIIQALGHDVTVVHSGREAVETIKRLDGAIDVVFSDISMPDMNGHELAEQLRVLRTTGTLHAKCVIAMSGYSDPEERAKSIQSGFDRHIVKPPEIGDLEMLLNEIARM